MLSTSELRLGNSVLVSTSLHPLPAVCEVQQIMANEIRVETIEGSHFNASISEISGILVDADVIKQYGFMLQAEDPHSYYKAPIILVNDSEGWHLALHGWHIGHNIYYLHQLQNLYFALCLEELKLKHAR